MSGERKHVSVAIVGGGIAGVWLLRILSDLGINAWLFEAEGLGAGQTLASQGMIHGGLKYQLHAGRDGLGESLAHMPDFWRACLRGQGAVDLRGAETSSDHYYLFSPGGMANRLTAFLGSRMIVGRAEKCSRDYYPEALRHNDFSGSVYQLQDVVLNVPSILNALTSTCAHRCFRGSAKVDGVHNGQITSLFCNGEHITADCYVFCAGAGNDALIADSPLAYVKMQRRPLKQAIVTGALPTLHAHVASPLSGTKPRVTITSHESDAGTTWYLGGALAETGTTRSDPEQVSFTRSELVELFPWLSFDGCTFDTLDIDRAEPDQLSGGLPDSPFVEKVGNAIVCWPTKLTLAPLMADFALSHIKPLIAGNTTSTLPELEVAKIASLPFG